MNISVALIPVIRDRNANETIVQNNFMKDINF